MTTTQQAWVITGPTAGIGRRTALELARHGTVILVGRSRSKLEDVEAAVAAKGGTAVAVLCDLSDVADARRAATEIAALDLPIAGVLNNAGIFPTTPSTTSQGWDTTFATDHLGPFAFTEALLPALPDGAQVLFVVSAVEDPERKLAVAAGFRGARYLSAEASAQGQWAPGGSSKAGFDAYATAKQGNLATALAFARQTPRLRFNAVEPGFSPGSDLGRDANPVARLFARYVLSPIAPFIKYWSTPPRAARMIATVLTDETTGTGTYFDERARPMLGSSQVRDLAFQDRVVAETRALLATVPSGQQA